MLKGYVGHAVVDLLGVCERLIAPEALFLLYERCVAVGDMRA